MLLSHWTTGGPEAPESTSAELRSDHEDEPLPAGAVLRLGTVRLRHLCDHVSFCPDGRHVVSVGGHVIHVWSAASGVEVSRIEQIRGRFFETEAAFAPGSDLFVVGNHDGAVLLFDKATGREVRRFVGLRERPQAVAFSRDGALVAGGGGDPVTRVWKVAGRRPYRKLVAPGPLASEATERGRAASLNGSRRGACHVRAMDFARGNLLATGGDGPVVLVWDVARARLARRLVTRFERVEALRFHPTAPLLAVAGTGAGAAIELWDTASGERRRELRSDDERARLNVHADGVRSVSFSPDGETLVAAGPGARLAAWELASGRVRAAASLRDGEAARSVSCSPDGRRVVATAGRTLSLWSLPDLHRIAGSPGHEHAVESVACASEAGIVVSGGRDGAVHLWSPEDGRALARRQIDAPVLSVAISADANAFAAGDERGGVSRFRGADPDRVARLEGHAGAVRSLALAPAGDRLFSAGDDGLVLAWGRAAPHARFAVPGGTGVRCLALAPDGRSLAAADASGEIRIHDAASLAAVRSLETSLPAVGMAFAADGRLLVAASQYGMTVLDAHAGREVATLPAVEPRAIVGRSAGRAFVCAGAGGEFYFWTLGQRELRVAPGQAGTRALTLDRSARHLIAAGEDSSLLFWDLAALERRARRC